MKTKEKFKVVRFRSFLVVALCLIASIFTCLLALRLFALGIALFAVLSAALVATVIATRKKRPFIPFTFALAAVLCAVSFTLFYVSARDPAPMEGEHSVYGVIDSVSAADDELTVVLKRVELDGVRTKSGIRVSIGDYIGSGFEFIKPGDTLSFRAKLYTVRRVDGFRVNASAFRLGIDYKAYPSASSCIVSFGKQSPADSLRSRIYGALSGQLGHPFADIAYGMLTGDKSGLAPSVRDYFGVSGLGHLLAVSGLHVGFLAAGILFVLKKAPRLVRVLVTASLLWVYAAFVGFSSSAVRAVLMCTIGLVTIVNGRRKDALNALMCAASVIMTVSPYSLFDVGFIMSCGAVLGIVFFSKYITKGLRRVRVPKRLASAVSVSAAAQLGILPCTIFYFHSVQLYSVVSNIILMPVIMLTFVVLVLSVLIVTILPFAGVLLTGAGVGLKLIDTVAYGVSLIPFSSILVYGGGIVFICYVLYFVLSPFFMLPVKKRFVNIGVIILAAALCFVPVGAFSEPHSIIPVNGYKDVTSIVSYNGGVYIIGDLNDADRLSYKMTAFRIKKVDAVYLTGLTERNAVEVGSFCRVYTVGKVYFPADRNVAGVSTLAKSGADLHMFECGEDLSIPAVYDGQRFVGYKLRPQARDILFLGYKTRYDKLPQNIRGSAGVIRCFTYLDAEPEIIYLTNLTLDFPESVPAYLFPVQAYENLSFDYITGEAFEHK